MKIAAKNVCTDKDGNLVSDLDPRAAILVAVAGQAVQEAAVDGYRDGAEFFVDAPVATEDANPLPVPLQSDNLLDTVSKLSGPGLAKLRSKLSPSWGVRLQSTGDAANAELTYVIFQTIGASPENPILVEFVQHILDPFTGDDAQFDLVERDSIRRVRDGASAGGTNVLTSATMNWQSRDVGQSIKIGINPGRHYTIRSRKTSSNITISDNIILPSSGLVLTMDGAGTNEVTIATKDGFSAGVTPVSGGSRFEKPITSDKVYSVVFVPGDAGDGIFAITARALHTTIAEVQ